MLLHICCGPCSTACVEALRKAGVEPVLYFSNDNLSSRQEYDRRLEAARTFADAARAELRAKPYDHGAWKADIAGLEKEPERGARCAKCFLHSLRTAAAEAASSGISALSTSLSVSPHKRTGQLFPAGRQAAEETPGVRFVECDFKKSGGYLRSVELSRRYALYRQTFCGCEFSMRGQDG